MAKLKERYANDLLAISEENGTFERDLQQAVMVRDILNSDDIKKFLINSYVSNSVKRQLFNRAFSNKITWYMMGFLYQMIRNRRESLIIPVLNEYILLLKKRLGIIEAKVVSAAQLTEKQAEALRYVLSKKIGMEVEIEAKVDPDILGGFYVIIDGHIFDSTIKTELINLKDHLKRGIANDS